MQITKGILSLLVGLALVQGCRPDDVASTVSAQRSFELDPSIASILRSHDLDPSDLASGLKGSQITRKSVAVGNERITYFETSGNGPDVVLIHGNGQSSNAFARQLSSPLGSVFHIVALDLPGHGLSARSPEPATTYQLPGYADVVVKFLKTLNLDHAVLVGWSLGGSILFEAADQLPNVPGLMVIGAPPVANPFDPSAFLPSPVAGLLFQQDLTEEQIQAIVPAFFKPDAQNVPDIFFQDVRVQDPLARFFAGVMVATGNFKDEPQVVRNLSVPLAVLQGEQEQLTSTAYIRGLTIPTLWHDRLWVVPDAGHIAQWENPDFVNPLIAAFVLELNSPTTGTR